MSSLEKLLLLVAGLLLVLIGMALTAMRRPARKRKASRSRSRRRWFLQAAHSGHSGAAVGGDGWAGLTLAAYCLHRGFTGSLPWLSAMVGLPWTAHGTVCAFYLNMAKSDHRSGGITYDAAAAVNFNAPAGAGGLHR